MARHTPDAIYHIFYRTTNIITEEYYYGKHSTNDPNDDYLGSGLILKRAIKKYGKDIFKKENLFIFDNEDDCLKKEAEIVNETVIRDPKCYNLVLGGEGSWTHLKHLAKCYDNTGKCYMVSKEEFSTGKHKGIAKGKLVCYDKDGKSCQVNVDDERIKTGELAPFSKGRVIVKDKIGNSFVVSKTDPRYVSGELVSLTTGKITVKDKDGKTLSVEKTDPRYISGELVSIITGKVVVKDKDGNTFQVDKSDQRYLSGELVHMNTGAKNYVGQNNKIYHIETSTGDILIIDNFPLWCKENKLNITVIRKTFKSQKTHIKSGFKVVKIISKNK